MPSSIKANPYHLKLIRENNIDEINKLQNGNNGGLKLMNANLSNLIIGIGNSKKNKLNLNNSNFFGANLFNTHFYKANIRNANLDETNLRKAEFHDIDFCNSSFKNAYISNATFNVVHLNATPIENLTITDSVFTGLDATGARFTQSVLRKITTKTGALNKNGQVRKNDFSAATFEDVTFSDIELLNCGFSIATTFENCLLNNMKMNDTFYHAGRKNCFVNKCTSNKKIIFLSYSFDPRSQEKINDVRTQINKNYIIDSGKNMSKYTSISQGVIDKINNADIVIGLLIKRKDKQFPTWVAQELAVAKAFNKTIIPICEDDEFTDFAEKLLGGTPRTHFTESKKSDYDNWKDALQDVSEGLK